MKTLRASLRLLYLALATLLLIPLCLALVLVASLFGRAVRYRVVMLATPVFCRINLFGFGVRVHREGARDGRAKIFVANHVSYLDILIAGAATGGVFVSRHDVKDWPVMGWFARMAGTVFIDRTSLRSAIESSRGLVERVREGARITLFPEGGILPGSGVKPFRPFLLAAIGEEELPVQPMAIVYTAIDGSAADAVSRSLVEWHDGPLHQHAWRVMRMRSVHATVRFRTPLTGSDGGADAARALAERLRAEVAAALAGAPGAL
jgi:1-acyl-sn-glycerol-3-phosphate acyltransferase